MLFTLGSKRCIHSWVTSPFSRLAGSQTDLQPSGQKTCRTPLPSAIGLSWLSSLLQASGKWPAAAFWQGLTPCLLLPGATSCHFLGPSRKPWRWQTFATWLPSDPLSGYLAKTVCSDSCSSGRVPFSLPRTSPLAEVGVRQQASSGAPSSSWGNPFARPLESPWLSWPSCLPSLEAFWSPFSRPQKGSFDMQMLDCLWMFFFQKKSGGFKKAKHHMISYDLI